MPIDHRSPLASRPGALAPPGIALVFCWWLVLRALWPEWSQNPQYQFGQLMPVFCLVLFALRWPDRPLVSAIPPAGRAVAAGLFGLGVLLLACLQPVLESNQDWRLVQAASAAGGIAVTLASVCLLGGAAWLRHFAFPVLFLLIAIPLPSGIEGRLMAALMEGNARIAVEILHWLGYEAVQRGNLIALPCGLLGVEEACSGVRSLQSGLMVSLFAGEYFRLRAGFRCGLVLLALLTALAGNIARTVTLSVVASTQGLHAIEAWHDPAGIVILCATLAIVGLAAWLLAGRRVPARLPVEGHAPEVLLSRLAGMRIASWGACCLWIISLAGTGVWYRLHESSGISPAARWTLRPGAAGDGVQVVKIPEKTLAILLHPGVAFSERWADGAGVRWQLFYFQWEAGRTAIQTAMAVHDPRNCLGAIGMRLEETYPSSDVTAAGVRIPFRRFLFSDGGIPLYVFQAVLREDDPERGLDATPDDYSAAGRLRAVLRGQRNRGLRVLEVAVWGASGLDDAQRRLQDVLSKRIQPVPQS